MARGAFSVFAFLLAGCAHGAGSTQPQAPPLAVNQRGVQERLAVARPPSEEAQSQQDEASVERKETRTQAKEDSEAPQRLAAEQREKESAKSEREHPDRPEETRSGDRVRFRTVERSAPPSGRVREPTNPVQIDRDLRKDEFLRRHDRRMQRVRGAK